MDALDAGVLRVYSRITEKSAGVPVYRAIIEAARHRHLAGASVFPVVVGYGSHRKLHDLENEYASFDMPIVVEVVDSIPRLGELAADLDAIVGEGLLVLNQARVWRCGQIRADDQSGRSAATERPVRTSRLTAPEGTIAMKIEGAAQRLTVYIGSADTWGGHNLCVAIVDQCRKLGLAGATVTRGIMGFGKHSVVHKAHLLGLSDDLPEKIEIVDKPEEIERLLPVLDPMIGGGLIIVEDVHVVRYLHEQPGVEKGAK